MASATKTEDASSGRRVHTTDFGFIPIPKYLRYDPERPFPYKAWLIIAYGVGSTFTVMNLYYCQPLLVQLAKAFGVTDSEISTVPTLVQAGYAVGLVFISPLGDLVRRRQLILLLVLVSTCFTIGLCTTSNIQAFEALCFLVGASSVVPQVLIPLAADLAPPERKASAVSIVLSGLMLGILLARVLAGVIANFTTYKVVYYLAIGVQGFVLFGTYLIVPDYPAKNVDLSYIKVIYTMVKYAFTEPLVIQASLLNIASSAVFGSFWVTLTFLLTDAPYRYSTLDIGLFGLLGMVAVLSGPFSGRLIDNLVPWYATLVATVALLVSQAIQVGGAGINIGAVVVACFGIDVARQVQLVSLSTAVFKIEPSARSRLNAILLLAYFIGLVMGTEVGAKTFLKYGWQNCNWVMFAICAFEFVLLGIRGPHVPRYTWFGWKGGFEARKRVVDAWEKEQESKTVTPGSINPEKLEEDSPHNLGSRDASNAV